METVSRLIDPNSAIVTDVVTLAAWWTIHILLVSVNSLCQRVDFDIETTYVGFEAGLTLDTPSSSGINLETTGYTSFANRNLHMELTEADPTL